MKLDLKLDIAFLAVGLFAMSIAPSFAEDTTMQETIAKQIGSLVIANAQCMQTNAGISKALEEANTKLADAMRTCGDPCKQATVKQTEGAHTPLGTAKP